MLQRKLQQKDIMMHLCFGDEKNSQLSTNRLIYLQIFHQ